MFRIFVLVVLSLPFMGLTPPAYADWSSPKFLTTDAELADGDTQVLVSNAAGDVMAASVIDDGFAIVVRRMSPGSSTWGAKKLFASETHYAYWPSGAMDAEGRSCVTWTSGSDDDPISQIRAACFKPGVGWSRVKMLSSGTEDALVSQVVMSKGVASFFWVEGDTLRTRRWENGTWRKAKDSEQALFPDYDTGIDSTGRITVAFTLAGSPFRVGVRTITPTGKWSSLKQMCPADVHCQSPSVAVNANGTSLVTWVRNPSPDPQHAEARHRLKNGSWSPVETVYEADGALDVDVTSNGSANTFAVGIAEDSGGSTTIATRHRFADGTWSPLVPIDDAVIVSGAARMRLQMDAAKRVTVVWRNGAEQQVLWARVLADGETVGSSGGLSDIGRQTTNGDDLAIALRGKNEIHVMYQDRATNGDPFRVSWVRFTP